MHEFFRGNLPNHFICLRIDYFHNQLIDHFQYNKTLNSPKDEQFVIVKKENVTATVPLRPFSLLPYLHELKAAGLQYIVIDLSNMAAGKKEMEELASRLSGKGNVSKLPTFNYLGELE